MRRGVLLAVFFLALGLGAVVYALNLQTFPKQEKVDSQLEIPVPQPTTAFIKNVDPKRQFDFAYPSDWYCKQVPHSETVGCWPQGTEPTADETGFYTGVVSIKWLSNPSRLPPREFFDGFRAQSYYDDVESWREFQAGNYRVLEFLNVPGLTNFDAYIILRPDGFLEVENRVSGENGGRSFVSGLLPNVSFRE